MRATLGAVRDALAARLLRYGVSPNQLTVAGLLLTACAAICLLFSASSAPPWEAAVAPTRTGFGPLLAGLLLTGAFLADLLDGAVARVGNRPTSFGALLDSTLDRFGDLLVFLACAIHFSLVGNVTYTCLSVAAATHAVLISYVKARAENLVESCAVGYWQRGERCGVFLAAAYAGHIPAALWLLGTLPLLTVVHRMRHAHRTIIDTALPGRGLQPAQTAVGGSPGARGSFAYCLGTAGLVILVIAGPLVFPWFYGASDPLRVLLGHYVIG